MKRKNKKGSHVGVVLSFVVFITFIIFIYTVLEPIVRVERDKLAILSYLRTELTEEFSANYTTGTVNIKAYKNPNQYCIKFKNFLTQTEMIPPHIIVKNELNQIQESYKEGNDLKVNRKVKSNLFYRIYNSSEFNLTGEKTINPCIQIEEHSYNIGLIRTEVQIFESRILNLTNEYNTDYENLKERLNVPTGNDFGFSFTYNNETIIGTNEKEISTDIYAREFPIQYVNVEASLESGFLNIRVW